MNLLEQLLLELYTIDCKKKGYFQNSDRDEMLMFLLKSEMNLNENILYLIEKFNIQYKDFPMHFKHNYKLIVKACLKRPKTLKEIFPNFHLLAELMKHITLSELIVILLNDTGLNGNEIECVLSAKRSQLNDAAKKIKPKNANETISTI